MSAEYSGFFSGGGEINVFGVF